MKSKKEIPKKIRVIQIIGQSQLKKSEEYLFDLIKKLDKKKFDVTCIVTPGAALSGLKKIKQIEIETIAMAKNWDFHAISKIRKIIGKATRGGSTKAIVHCHGDLAGRLGRLACISAWRREPFVIYTQTYIASAKIWTLIRLWFLDLFTNVTITFSKPVVEFFIKKRVTRPDKLIMMREEVGRGKKVSLARQTEQLYEQI